MWQMNALTSIISTRECKGGTILLCMMVSEEKNCLLKFG